MNQYNQKIKHLLLNNQQNQIHHEKNFHGGGVRKQNTKPLPIISVQQPSSFETTPVSSLHRGGKIPKILKDLGHETIDAVKSEFKKGAKELTKVAIKKELNIYTFK